MCVELVGCLMRFGGKFKEISFSFSVQMFVISFQCSVSLPWRGGAKGFIEIALRWGRRLY